MKWLDSNKYTYAVTHTHTHTQTVSTFSVGPLLCVIFLFFRYFQKNRMFKEWKTKSVLQMKSSSVYQNKILNNTNDYSYPKSQKSHINTLILIQVTFEPLMVKNCAAMKITPLVSVVLIKNRYSKFCKVMLSSIETMHLFFVCIERHLTKIWIIFMSCHIL